MIRGLASPVPTAAAFAVVLVFVPAGTRAQVNTLPPELQGVGVTEHLNGSIPRDAVFRDHRGRRVQLGQFFDGRRPVLLNLVYHRCPMLCSMVLNATLRVLERTAWTVGEQFDVITLSIDPRDGPAEATEKRLSVLQRYRRPQAERGWHFLTGEEANIRRVADALGFQYRYDARQQQYAHPAVIFLLTPDGRIARYLYGIAFDPNDVRLGLLEASQGRSISTIERLILFCYHYDPQGRKYVLVARRVMQLGGVVTVVLLGGLLGTLWFRERWRRRSVRLDFDGRSGDTMASHMPPQDVRG